MATTISLQEAARLNGDSDATYRAAISQYLPKVGKLIGGARHLTVGEVVALRTLTELNSSKINLRDAAVRVAGLLPFINDIASGKLGRKGGCYAVEMWGFSEGDYQRARYICDGEADLAACVAAAAEKHWPNMRIVNLSAILVETKFGWNIATLGQEEAANHLREQLAGRPEEQQAWAWALFQELSSRLDHLGNRRPDPPSRGRWEPYPTRAVDMAPPAAA